MKIYPVLLLSLLNTCNCSYAEEKTQAEKKIVSFEDRLFFSNEGKKSEHEWDYIQEMGQKIAAEKGHKLKFWTNKEYKTCYHFTNSHTNGQTLDKDQIALIAHETNTFVVDSFQHLKQVATTTFEIYVKNYNESEYETIFVEFFVNANVFDGLCIDELFATNIYNLVVAYDGLYTTPQ